MTISSKMKLNSNMRGVIRYLRAKGSSPSKFHAEIVSDYSKDVKDKKRSIPVAQPEWSGHDLSQSIDCPTQKKNCSQDRF